MYTQTNLFVVIKIRYWICNWHLLACGELSLLSLSFTNFNDSSMWCSKLHEDKITNSHSIISVVVLCHWRREKGVRREIHVEVVIHFKNRFACSFLQWSRSHIYIYHKCTLHCKLKELELWAQWKGIGEIVNQASIASFEGLQQDNLECSVNINKKKWVEIRFTCTALSHRNEFKNAHNIERYLMKIFIEQSAVIVVDGEKQKVDWIEMFDVIVDVLCYASIAHLNLPLVR